MGLLTPGLCDRFWKEYAAVLDNMHEWFGDVRVVVLSSALPKIFSAGIDCKFDHAQLHFLYIL